MSYLCSANGEAGVSDVVARDTPKGIRNTPKEN